MDKQEKQEAKKVLVELMQAGHSWQEASEKAGIQTTRPTAYSWWKKYREQGESGLQDGRQGHVAKMHEPILQWLETVCSQDHSISSEKIQKMLQDQFGLVISITHLNRTRAAHGWTRKKKMRSAFKKEQGVCC
jgi:transposase